MEDRGKLNHGTRGSTAVDDGGGHTDHDLHGPRSGHLPPVQQNVRRVGAFRTCVPDGTGNCEPTPPGDVSDVTALERITKTTGQFVDVEGLPSHDGRKYAYVGNWGRDCRTGGTHVIDYTNPRSPVQVNYIDATGKTYRTEGMHAVRVDSPAFTGDLLALSNEWCADATSSVGGFTLIDISNPKSPQKLVDGFGDFGGAGQPSGPFTGPLIGANESHSVIVWDAGQNLYLAAIDNYELLDVDLFDITDPRNPKLLAETGLPRWPGVNTNAYGSFPNAHDFDIVFDPATRKWWLTVSYWDAGWVTLDVTNPARPKVLDESDYLPCDPVYSWICPPEGNGHQGEWNKDINLFIGTDEDQSSFRLPITVTSGPLAGNVYPAGEFAWTAPAEDVLDDGVINGPVIYGGYGCPWGRDQIPPASELGPLEPGEEAIVVFQRGPVGDPNEGANQNNACFFSEKVESGQLKGYDVVIIANHHAGAQAGAVPDAFICGSMGHEFDVFNPPVVGLCVGHRFLHEIFGYEPDYTFPYPVPDPLEPEIGDRGIGEIEATTIFDGWGYARVLNRNHEEIGQCSLPEQSNPDFATGFGDLSVHEVEVDRDPRYDGLAYFSWYSAGFRVFGYRADGTCVQLGAHIGKGGNELWGVAQAFDQNNERIVLASDRHYGLVIYKYTGPLPS